MEPPPPFEADLLGLTHREAIRRLERTLGEGLPDHGVHVVANPGVVNPGGVLGKGGFGEAHSLARHEKRVRAFGGARAGDIPPSGLIRRGLAEQAQAPEGFPEEGVVELPGYLKAGAEHPGLRLRDPQKNLAHETRGRRFAQGTSVRSKKCLLKPGRRFGPDGPTG